MEIASRTLLDEKVREASLEAGSEEVYYTGVEIVCQNHRNAKLRVFYKGGVLRMQCHDCGFDVGMVRVHDDAVVEEH